MAAIEVAYGTESRLEVVGEEGEQLVAACSWHDTPTSSPNTPPQELAVSFAHLGATLRESCGSLCNLLDFRPSLPPL